MKNKFLYPNRIALAVIVVLTTLILLPTLTGTPAPSRACATPVTEQYGVSHSIFGDTQLRWRAYIPDDGDTHPAIIVIHGGNFDSGDFRNMQTDQDLVCAGF